MHEVLTPTRYKRLLACIFNKRLLQVRNGTVVPFWYDITGHDLFNLACFIMLDRKGYEFRIKPRGVTCKVRK